MKPDWFADSLGWAIREDHYKVVDSRPWWWRFLHWLRRCPACRRRAALKKVAAGLMPGITAPRRKWFRLRLED